MHGLYAASALILVRNFVRIAQYIQGYEGYVNSHKLFLYAFDAVPMFAVMVVMLVIYAPNMFEQGKGDGLQERVTNLQANAFDTRGRTVELQTGTLDIN